VAQGRARDIPTQAFEFLPLLGATLCVGMQAKPCGQASTRPTPSRNCSAADPCDSTPALVASVSEPSVAAGHRRGLSDPWVSHAGNRRTLRPALFHDQSPDTASGSRGYMIARPDPQSDPQSQCSTLPQS
jgi:hypothetical protein